MNIKQVANQFQNSMLAVVLAATCPSGALAQNGHSHETPAQAQQLTTAQGALLKIVRDNTARFKDVSVAEAEGYSLLFGCVSGPDSGAMGMHFVNLSLVASGVIDATRPQIVIYEPTPDGHLQLIGADFLVIASDWDKAHPGQGAPQLMGQLFHYFESPNRFGLPAFYTLHVWAWKDNPNGAFVNWHPNVSCQSFAGQ
ncbi:MAG TPA: hypothetical protein VJN89_14220 [Candidatus Acidoferrum sp.]|nr:hypothetical protein [Candidatus Acidoferrum sp.]